MLLFLFNVNNEYLNKEGVERSGDFKIRAVKYADYIALLPKE
jgi:hypothetical protein